MHWVVFDYGEVIVQRTTALPDLANRLGVPLGGFEQAYWAHRDDYDRGTTDLEYWQAVGDQLGVAVDARFAEELAEIDVEGWGRTDPAVIELLEALDEAGAALALLSNASSSFGRWVEKQPWTRHFRHLLFSGDLGMAKPDRQIFELLVERLGAEPGDCLFFDDRQSNVDGARVAGLRAHRWLGVATAHEVLD
ncbi:HAD family hydrolase [Amycolatopsis suaedae]|uniref:HAD family phosphatase n=1 Tax=Amycolatopsis suaedae TaxID=2510978 RepID=A0A4Q7JBQ1_9PSEU|nr:HAD family phosphatase [Amycolatopsis suaedae]RZQ65261.1 HAD family phosphatase [Amycolatopsis suaedae]